MRYLCSRSAAFDEIWYDDASYPSQPDGKQKLKNLKSTMADGGHLKNRKIAISPKTVWPILLKICKITRICSPELTSC